MPVRNGNNTTGIIQAIMQDDGNGILTILGSGLSIENIEGNYMIDGNHLYQFFYGKVEVKRKYS